MADYESMTIQRVPDDMIVHRRRVPGAPPSDALAEADARLAELAAANGRLQVEVARLCSELEGERFHVRALQSALRGMRDQPLSVVQSAIYRALSHQRLGWKPGP